MIRTKYEEKKIERIDLKFCRASTKFKGKKGKKEAKFKQKKEKNKINGCWSSQRRFWYTRSVTLLCKRHRNLSNIILEGSVRWLDNPTCTA